MVKITKAMKKAYRLHMPTHIAAKCDLAVAYADDGAYHSAARVLRQLLADVEAHAAAVHPTPGEIGRG